MKMIYCVAFNGNGGVHHQVHDVARDVLLRDALLHDGRDALLHNGRDSLLHDDDDGLLRDDHDVHHHLHGSQEHVEKLHGSQEHVDEEEEADGDGLGEV